MDNIGDILFIDRFPKLDLHGYDSQSAKVAINDFINDNKKMKNDIITIVHGIGSGTIKNITHETLKKNKNVIKFSIYYNNPGCTIVHIIV